MVVAVKCELCTTMPLMLDSPKHCCTVLLIECIPHINEDKPPVLLMQIFPKEDTHGMNAALYPFLHAPGQLFRPAGGLHLLPLHPKQALCHQPSPSFSDPDRSDSLLLIQCDQPSAHHGSIGGLWAAHCSATPWNPQQSTAVPHSLPQNVASSVGG